MSNESILEELKKQLSDLNSRAHVEFDSEEWSEGYNDGFASAVREYETLITDEADKEPEEEVKTEPGFEEVFPPLLLKLVSGIKGAAFSSERNGELFPLSTESLEKISESIRKTMNTTTGDAANANGLGSFERIIGLATQNLADSRIPEGKPNVAEDPRAQDEYDAYQASVDNGFWDDAPNYKHPLFLEFIGNKLLLLVGEIIEAHEEIRNGRGVDEIYYPTNAENVNLPIDSQGVRHKPEGFLVELADLSIRLDDLVGYFVKEWGTPHLYEIKEEKREYNRSRGYKHGKKF